MQMLGQTRGKYIPTKYDQVKKVIPEQVYGNPKYINNRDSTEAEVNIDIQKEKNEVEIEAENEVEKELSKLNKKEQLDKSLNLNQTNKQIQKSNKITQSKQIKVNPKKEIWLMEDCIQYALHNNLQIVESDLNKRMSQLMLDQQKKSKLPNLNGDLSAGKSLGRGIDPTSNQFVNHDFVYSTLGLSSQTLLFGWFQKKNSIEKNNFDLEAITYANSQLKDDISLNVATGYLRILMLREQIKIYEEHININLHEFNNMALRQRELDYYAMRLHSQLMLDSAQLVNIKSDEKVAMLELRALMNFSLEDQFEIQPFSNVGLSNSNLGNLTSAEYAYANALENQNQIKYNHLKLLSAKKTYDIANSMQYPQLTFYNFIGTNYSSNIKNITGQTYEGESVVGNVNIAGTTYPITESNYSFTTQTSPISKQYTNHLRFNAGLNLSLPIFNAYVNKTSIQKAKIGLVAQQLTIDMESQKLKQDIYSSYEVVKSTLLQYETYQRAVLAFNQSMTLATQNLQLDYRQLQEYLTTLQNLTQSKILTANSKYELLLKLLVLDYYMGNSLKL